MPALILAPLLGFLCWIGVRVYWNLREAQANYEHRGLGLNYEEQMDKAFTSALVPASGFVAGLLLGGVIQLVGYLWVLAGLVVLAILGAFIWYVIRPLPDVIVRLILSDKER